MSERRRGLGRGLGALIPSAPAEDAESNGTGHEEASRNSATPTEVSPGSQTVGTPTEPAGKAASAGPVAGAEHDGAAGGAGNGNQDSRRDSGKHGPATVPADVTPTDTSAPAERNAEPDADRAATPEPGPAAGTSDAEAPEAEGPGPGTYPASEVTGADEPGRVAGGGRGRSVSPAARQKAMKARMDMGEAFRGTSLGTRPSDMFFLPSAPAPNGEATPENTDASTHHAAQRSTEAPASDTPASDTPDVGPEDAGPGLAPQVHATTGRPAETTGNGHVSRETAADEEDLTAVPGATFAEVPVNAIHPNRKQPRQVFDEDELAELAYSIGELGVLQPIVVRPSRESGDVAYELVMGERRWRAAQRAGLAAIPAIVRETADDSLLRDALLENLHRSQLNPLEEAAAYQQLMEEFGATQEELSRRIGRSRPQISNTIRLLRLPPLVQRRVAAGVLSSGHARALLSLSDPAEMERLAQRIVAEGLSVRATEEAVQLAEGSRRAPQRSTTPAGGQQQERLAYIADAFADRLDTSVKIALGARKGKMTIEFASVDDLNRIIEVLDPGMDPQ